MKHIAIIDNYDSFTYNLVHIIKEANPDRLTIMRNDEIDYADLDHCSHLIMSPGPGIPDEAGSLKKVIQQYYETKKILGVCLGHQALGEVFGAQLYNLPQVFHGKKSLMHKTAHASLIFESIPDQFYAGRYHSWAIDEATMPSSLQVTAVDDDHAIMAIQHMILPIYGVQFHPESIMTEHGQNMINNFIQS